MPTEEPGFSTTNKFRLEHRANSNTPTVGHIRYERILMTGIGPKSIGRQTFTWKYPVDISSGYLYGAVDEVDGQTAMEYGDEVVAFIDVGVVGIITDDYDTGDTILQVSQTVIDNVDVGDYIILIGNPDNSSSSQSIPSKSSMSSESSNSSESLDNVSSSSSSGYADTNTLAREVITKNIDTLTLTLDKGIPEDRGAGDFVQLNRYFIGRPDARIVLVPSSTNHQWGQDTLDSSQLPAETKLVVEYYNNSSTKTKVSAGILTILY